MIGYRETSKRVPNVEPALLTRFRWRARRRCARLNAHRGAPFYRWEVCDWLDGRWAVVAMQNTAMLPDSRVRVAGMTIRGQVAERKEPGPEADYGTQPPEVP